MILINTRYLFSSIKQIPKKFQGKYSKVGTNIANQDYEGEHPYNPIKETGPEFEILRQIVITIEKLKQQKSSGRDEIVEEMMQNPRNVVI